MRPISAIVRRMPIENRVANQNALLVDIAPCPPMKPTIKGILARWQGLNNMLSIPQIKDAARAITGVDWRELDNQENRTLSII